MKSFSLINQTKINEYNTATKMFTHASGAKILFLSNEDENKCFILHLKNASQRFHWSSTYTRTHRIMWI